MDISTVEVEKVFAPLFENAVLYNLALPQKTKTPDSLDLLEKQLGYLSEGQRNAAINTLNRALQPKESMDDDFKGLRVVPHELRDKMIALFNSLRAAYPPWPFELLCSSTREKLKPENLIDEYFNIWKAWDGAKRSSKAEFLYQSELIDCLDKIHQEKSLTKFMVSIRDDGFIEKLGHGITILCRCDKVSRLQALKIAHLQIQNKDPFELVNHLPITSITFSRWGHTLIALYALASGQSNHSATNKIIRELKPIPQEFHSIYKDAANLNSYRNNLKNCQSSLNKFYHSSLSDTELHPSKIDLKKNVMDELPPDNTVKVILHNYVSLYFVLINYSSFILELSSFNKCLQEQDKLEPHASWQFINSLCQLAELRDRPDDWAIKMDRLGALESGLKNLVEKYREKIGALLKHNFPFSFWGYYILDGLSPFPEPDELLLEFARLKGECNGRFAEISHNDISSLKEKVGNRFALMIPRLMSHKVNQTPSSGFLLGQSYPYTIIDQHDRTELEKFELAIATEQRTSTRVALSEYNQVNVNDLEKILIGLAYFYLTKLRHKKMSKKEFVIEVDRWYPDIVSAKKVHNSIKTVEQLIMT